MAKTKRYVIVFGREMLTVDGTAREAAKKAARLAARGTLNRGGTIYEQPENAKMPDKVKLLDEDGGTLMNCRPSIVSPGAARAGRRVRYTFANCSITPKFKRELKARKRRR